MQQWETCQPRNVGASLYMNATRHLSPDAWLKPLNGSTHGGIGFSSNAVAGPIVLGAKLRKRVHLPRVFAKPTVARADFPRRTELNGFIDYAAKGHIRESFGISRTMVTILRLREIQSFGFRGATGTEAAGSGIAVGSEDRTLRHSFSGSSRCGANLIAAIPVATLNGSENNGV